MSYRIGEIAASKSTGSSSLSSGKNGRWPHYTQAALKKNRVVRPRGPPRARSFLRRHADILEVEVRRVECRRCGKVKQERLDFLA
jgi:hypothetical protein